MFCRKVGPKARLSVSPEVLLLGVTLQSGIDTCGNTFVDLQSSAWASPAAAGRGGPDEIRLRSPDENASYSFASALSDCK